jgi:predicted O-linked N-acetylglucosamine transferase (SPINDLY family)
MQCDPQVSPSDLLKAHREWDQQHASVGNCVEQRSVVARSNRALRVGFISPDFGNHPVGRFLIGAFEHLPRDIETYCYSVRPTEDELTRRFQSAATCWHNTRRMTDDELTNLVKHDGVDVLIDLVGHTGQHRLLVFARRAAPIQATWIGYPGTTGLTAMDYIIADRVLIPDEHRQFYSEQVAWMDGPWVSIEPPTFAVDVTPSSSPCLVNGQVTFGSFNKLDKTTPQVLQLWAKILQRVPGSTLELRNSGLADDETRSGILSVFESCGVDVHRIQCHGWASQREVYAAYQQIDIALDTFPFSGGATSADALWMGVPVVTLAGSTLAGRQTMSMLMHSGLTETIASSLDEYCDRAVSLALQPEMLDELRNRTRESIRSGPLCDPKRAGASLGRWLFEIATFPS